MDFDNIKAAMDNDAKKAEVNVDIAISGDSKLPLEQIRKKMKSEILTQLVIIVLFFAAVFIIPMGELSKSVYIIFMVVTCLITLGYLIRMAKFVKMSTRMTGSTKDVLQSILAELNLTIEVYKTSIIAGSLLLPISTAALLMGSKGKDALFEKWFLLKLNPMEMTIAFVAYLACALFIIYMTKWWADHMYGKDKRHLEEQLASLAE